MQTRYHNILYATYNSDTNKYLHEAWLDICYNGTAYMTGLQVVIINFYFVPWPSHQYAKK